MFLFFILNKTKTSGRCDSDKEAAELIYMQFNRLNLKNGILIGVPIPAE